jgi:hypothetical protein
MYERVDNGNAFLRPANVRRALCKARYQGISSELGAAVFPGRHAIRTYCENL